jgi:predicted pyridoxine 5'-phosphate oxidase superfamily flavin-nucleotide-binding protein
MTNPVLDVIFTPSVRAVQERYGSRDAVARLAARGRWKSELDEDVIAFIRARDSFYLGTASAAGQPYIQHRGGPAGFVRVMDNRTLIWPEYAGNRQYISAGNLQENAQAFMFLMDYQEPRRIKVWGRATMIEGVGDLVRPLETASAGQREPEFQRAIRFEIEVWDENCRQHIPRRHSDEQLKKRLERAETEVAKLRAELAALRESVFGRSGSAPDTNDTSGG